MAQQLRDVMTADPVTITSGDPLIDAARAMRDADIGDVIVTKEGGDICGIVTDRDITVRAVAEGRNPADLKVEDVCTKRVISLTPNDSVDDAVRLMRDEAIRRLPVVEGGHPVGVVALADLAVERDPESALADISAAPPNN